MVESGEKVSDDTVVVTVRRSGGFAGIRSESTVSSAELDGAERERFVSLVRKVKPAPAVSHKSPVRDAFTYTLRINDREWQIGESSLTDESRTLIDHVFRARK